MIGYVYKRQTYHNALGQKLFLRIADELYLSIVVDRANSRVNFIESTEGGMDIEDVAAAHLEAAFNKNATGRFLIFGEVMSLLSLANILREKFGDKYPIPTKEMPKWLVWLVAPLIDKTLSRKYIARNMGHPWRGDNSKSVKVLGIKYKPIERSAIEMFQQMIDNGSFERT